MAVNDILMPMADDSGDDDMMMEMLQNNIEAPREEPISPVESLKLQITEINNDMENVMDSMGSMMSQMSNSRSKREAQAMMDNMEVMSYHEHLFHQKQKSCIRFYIEKLNLTSKYK